MKVKTIIYLLSISTFLIGCGKSNSTPKNYDQGQIKIETSDQFSSFIDEALIIGPAPDGLGLLFKKDTNGYTSSLGTCTWFLIDQDTAYTNSHCIPEVLKENDDLDCSDHIGGVFKTSNGEERRRCGKVLYYSNIQNDTGLNKPDYAIIKLDRPVEGTTSFNVSRDGFEDGEVFSGHAINTEYLEIEDSNSYILYGAYKKIDCITYKNSLLSSFFENYSSLVPLFSTDANGMSCKVISGNSGSPVTANGTFNVKGIIFAGLKNEQSTMPTEDYFNVDELKSYGVLTNFRCIDLKKTITARDPNCDSLLEQDKKKSENQMNNILVADLKSLIIEELIKLPTSFKYEVNIFSEDNFTFYLSQKCMYTPNRWNNFDVQNIERKVVGDSFRDEFSSSLPFLKYHFDFEVDRFGLLKLNNKLITQENLKFKITDLNKVKSYSSKTIVGIKDTPQTRTSPLSLRLCSEDEMNTSIAENADQIVESLNE